MYISQIIDEICHFWPECHRPHYISQGAFGISFLLAENPQPVKGVRIVWITRQNATIKGFRFYQAAL
jgi:hypothetical protein